MENLLQEVFDNLEEIGQDVTRTHDVRLILDVMANIKNIGTNLKMIADELGLDVHVSTPID